jgi:hypothetical protein
MQKADAWSIDALKRAVTAYEAELTAADLEQTTG